ncbi:MAG: hypothetical protein WCI62_03885 [Erysipelotrichaceae bacterium]
MLSFLKSCSIIIVSLIDLDEYSRPDSMNFNDVVNLTVSTGLAYSVAQSVISAYDINNYFIGDVISYNPLTGEMGLKIEYVGTVVVVQYNRKGDIFRKLTFKDAFPTGQPETLDSLDYETTDAQELTFNIRSDHWVEELT